MLLISNSKRLKETIS